MSRRVLMMSVRKRQEIKNQKLKKLDDLKKQHAEAFSLTLSGKKRTLDRTKITRGNYTGSILVGRAAERNNIPSLATSACATEKVETPKYTGENLLGIALMHKSNYVPIFRKEDAVSVAKMRRN